MKRAIFYWSAAVVFAVLLFASVGWAGPSGGFPTSTINRICDGIGRQFACIASSMKNQYGFGGVADTLTSDSTVSRGTMMNIHRIKQGNDAILGELLPVFLSSRTQLDSSYLYSKWSSICWSLNNAFADSGGLSGIIQARAAGTNTVRLSPRFARVARANGIYLAPHAVFPDSLNFGTGAVSSGGAYSYSDSNAIDSTLYGPSAVTSGGVSMCMGNPWIKLVGATGTGACSLQVWGSNGSLVHGRRWIKLIDQTTDTTYLSPDVVGDSIYNIDSSKVKTYSGTLAGTILFMSRTQRADSL